MVQFTKNHYPRKKIRLHEKIKNEKNSHLNRLLMGLGVLGLRWLSF